MLISQYCYDRLDEIQKDINRVSHRKTTEKLTSFVFKVCPCLWVASCRHIRDTPPFILRQNTTIRSLSDFEARLCMLALILVLLMLGFTPLLA